NPVVKVNMRRSFVDAHVELPTEFLQTLFLINHESGGQISFSLEENRVQGGGQALDAVAAASRNGPGGAVKGASMAVFSRRNLYQGLGADAFSMGLSANGGSPAPGSSVGASSHQLRLSSFHDTIEGATLGVFARSAQRNSAQQEQSHNNRADIELIGTTIGTNDAQSSDLLLCTTIAGGDFEVGTHNTLSVLGRQMLGSGTRDNFYDGNRCDGIQDNNNDNTLEFLGSLEAWLHTNDDIAPPPPPEFFVD